MSPNRSARATETAHLRRYRAGGWGGGFPRDACTSKGGASTLRQRALRQPEDRTRDHESLDLARPLVDLRDLRVAVVPLDRELLGVAVAAEDLDRLGRLAPRDLGRVELRLRPLLRVRQALPAAPRRAVDEEARCVDLRRHVGELPLDRLEVGDSLPELAPLEGVLPRDVVRRLRDPDRLSGDPDPAAVERRHRDGKAPSRLSQA